MWVFDGNGFTMACLAVWIRNVALRWGSSAMARRSGAVDATAANAPVNVTRISVATSGTDFTAPEADFAALIRAAGFCPGRSHLSRGRCRSWTAPRTLLARNADVSNVVGETRVFYCGLEPRRYRRF